VGTVTATVTVTVTVTITTTVTHLDLLEDDANDPLELQVVGATHELAKHLDL
jgi:hypothetical protein